MVDKTVKKILEEKHYRVVGNHSAVQICRWTKNSLTGKGSCYKENFYGIKSHKCCQMSPFVSCPNNCLHCWRPIELDFNLKPILKEKNFDDPEKIIGECIKKQRKLINGFPGGKDVNMKKFEEAQEPDQFAISLIGEPTLYPKIGELVEKLREKGKTSFIVTNGLYPEKLRELKKEKQLPTQIYISLNSPNKEEYNKWHKSKEKNAWEKFNESLEIMSGLETRTAIRVTLIKDVNLKDKFLEGFSKLIKKANPDFVEVKSYMALGHARKRFGYECMPEHKDIKEYSKKLVEKLPEYKFLDEQEMSRIVLLGKDKNKMKIKKEEI